VNFVVLSSFLLCQEHHLCYSLKIECYLKSQLSTNITEAYSELNLILNLIFSLTFSLLLPFLFDCTSD